MDRSINGWTDRWMMVGQTEEWMDEEMMGYSMDGQVDRKD